jgi:NAD(P) transhydrogenase subunit beta
MDIIDLLFLIAAVLFVAGLKSLSRVSTARRGNALSSLGMLLAIVATVVHPGFAPGGAPIGLDWTWLLGGIALGTVLGILLALMVKMTAMPEMVALLNGFGGAASLLVALSAFYGDYLPNAAAGPAALSGTHLSVLGGHVWMIAVVASILVGSVTLTGSVVAMLKLAEKISGTPILLPARHLLLGGAFLAVIALSVMAGWFWTGEEAALLLIAAAVLSGILGILAVIPIGGADMPVVVSLLNSYSGIAASTAGFVMNNPLLITAGALVGASGIILSQIMCKAMNRSLMNVLVGGFGGAAPAGGGGKSEYTGVKSTSPEEAAMILADASSVIFVPGYGMAVAQAQHVVKELSKTLEKRGAQVRYAIHPVAGRMPGHMNVLLAEADVPYDQLVEMDMINGEFKNTDVVVVIGANDVVNPAAIEDPQSPIAGMPILNAHEARTVLVVKRSLSPGYAGIKNPLFERDNTLMCFGDGKAFLEEVLKELKAG